MSPSLEPCFELPGYLHEWDEAGNFVVKLVVAECCRVELQQVVELRDHLYQSNFYFSITVKKGTRKRALVASLVYTVKFVYKGHVFLLTEDIKVPSIVVG